MDYALAKELKEAGFPVRHWFSQGNVYFRGVLTPFSAVKDAQYEDGTVICYDIECVQIPTLSELIRACNEDKDSFFRLGLTTEGWRARDVRIEGEVVNGYPSPEEAVANLWLRINEK